MEKNACFRAAGVKLRIGRVHVFISITPLLPAPLIGLHLCKQTRAVIIHIPVQMPLMELVQFLRTLPWNMCVSEQFPQYMSILAFDQRIVVAMSSSGFGKFNAKFLQAVQLPDSSHTRNRCRCENPSTSNGNVSNTCLQRRDQIQLRDPFPPKPPLQTA